MRVQRVTAVPDWVVADLRPALELVPVPALIIDMDMRLLHANTAGLSSLPLGQDISAFTLADIVFCEDMAPLAARLAAQRIAPALDSSIDIRLMDNDGQPRWRAASFSCMPGIAEICVVTLLDVHERCLREIEARIWEERWNKALVGSGLGVWDHGLKENQFYYSDTWRQIRGHAADAETDSSYNVWIETIHPDDRDMLADFIKRQNAGDPTAITCEYREKHADGQYIWIECRGACVERDENGKPSRIIGTDIDITTRKTIESEMAHLKRRLELALAVTKIGVFEADIDDDTLLFDETLLSIMGLEGNQTSRGWQALIHPEDREAAVSRMDSKGEYSNHFRIIRTDGAIRHIRARSAPFVDQQGHRKFIGANWDVTDDIAIRDELQSAKTLAEGRARALEDVKARIEHNALHDFLTDLPNRRYLEQKLIESEQEADKGLAILHIDLDRFKQINDTLGHKAGDFMLLHASKVLGECAGPGRFVARIGGDEFVVLCNFETQHDLTSLADTIIKRMREPVHFGKTPCRIGASIGIAFEAAPGCDARAMLQNADIALYRAKGRGRNRYEFFDAELQQKVVSVKQMSDEILNALEHEEFIPFYQLQFCAQKLEIFGAESLARWKHPTRGVLAPALFLQVAEDLDVVSKIDAMILEKAVADLRGMRDLIPKISVNVSTRRLSDPELSNMLASLDLPPGMVSFELLETIFLDDSDEEIVSNIQALKARGIGIEIDDFGSGHASIVGLLKVAPDTLKIDRALIKPITTGRDERKLVASIIEIGRSLGIRVVAEGVETSEHVNILRDIGCDVLQGFALARPMGLNDLLPFIKRGAWRQN